ncbi:glycosyltransferase [Cytophaga hutchinsonii]|uniref:A-glycosyltransferase-related protein, glycosyltransferase family 4 protein n=1 Tax=Cytophaga hutchinsonii (strain ATCC 33406 / DSM 1761 / CIP 103989 / NBRC 15051 / NCIMB 9469 / D465) TaxID=269798 RepID=A0A6N4SPB7_CYTH3|nr:glycosyltransferase [Cytophaga hutchinsonii]ABG58176.1 a-glycosyltransferase-related protein, glycosyltransferase family 4 protein [Cytophaga hutchinsonii ATCC 33406]SFY02615.1 Glycosyltransferase involved in cell wall bisynthesis [Cytophaga hutchinsonii ATCC 33406]
MKIAVVIPSFYPAVVYGGTIFSSLNTCKELVKLGQEVFVSTTNTNMYKRLEVPRNKWTELQGIHVKYYNETIVDKLSLRLITSVWKDIRNADVIHVQAIYNTPVPASLFYARMLGKPVLLSPRGVMGDWIMNQGNSFKKTWLKFLIKPFANRVTWHATADQEAQEIRSRFPNAKIAIIPNGIDTEYFAATPWLSRIDFLKQFTGKEFNGDTKVIVSMGRIHKKKGLDLLIDAFDQVLKTLPDTVLLIAGQDEGELAQLQQRIDKYRLQDKIIFTGALNDADKKTFLIHADLFALTSHNENFGNVYAEALASGLPVVTSIYTPWLDLEQNGCGKAVGLNVDEIKQALLDYLNIDKTLVASAARSYIAAYSWESIGKRFQKVFEDLKNNENE